MNYTGAPKNKTDLLNSLKNKSYTPRIQFEEVSNFSQSQQPPGMSATQYHNHHPVEAQNDNSFMPQFYNGD